MLILLSNEDNVKNFIMDVDDDVPEVVHADPGVSDGVKRVNDDNGDDETVIQSLRILDFIEAFLENMPCLNCWRGNGEKYS